MIDHDDIMAFSTSVSCFVNCKKTQNSSGTYGCLGCRREGSKIKTTRLNDRVTMAPHQDAFFSYGMTVLRNLANF